jgi:mono/diheme cytochrome c family protein
MKNFLLGVLFTLVVLALGILIYLEMGFAEVRADIPPASWERALLFSAAHASVRRRAPEMPNPVPATDENLIAGGKIYLNECSGCHGAPGKAESISDSLYPPIPQLAANGTTYTESQIFFVTKHGVRLSGMFANGKWMPDEKIWTVAAYVKRIKALPPRVEQELAKPPAPAK